MPDIPGWGEFGDTYYPAIVAAAPPGSALVEVGVYCGRSLVRLATHARAAGKGLRVFGVDHHRGSAEHRSGPELMPEIGNTAGECLAHLTEAGVADDVTLIVADSLRTAALIADGSVWFAFLDAGHDEQSVAADIAAWWPKVAPGGYLAGHDHITGWDGVVIAVDAFLARRGLTMTRPVEGDSCWQVRKPHPRAD